MAINMLLTPIFWLKMLIFMQRLLLVYDCGKVILGQYAMIGGTLWIIHYEGKFIFRENPCWRIFQQPWLLMCNESWSMKPDVGRDAFLGKLTILRCDKILFQISSHLGYSIPSSSSCLHTVLSDKYKSSKPADPYVWFLLSLLLQDYISPEVRWPCNE